MTTMQPAHEAAGRRRRDVTLVVLAAAVLALLVGGAVFYLADSDDETSSTTVAAGGVRLPQNPSLSLLIVDGTWYVENDGNVTMSGVEVRQGPESVICELGTLSPDERAACAAAGDAEDLTAFGLGPQGQVVEVGSS